MHQSAVIPAEIPNHRLRVRSTRLICSWMRVGTMFTAVFLSYARLLGVVMAVSTCSAAGYRSQKPLRYFDLAYRQSTEGVQSNDTNTTRLASRRPAQLAHPAVKVVRRGQREILGSGRHRFF